MADPFSAHDAALGCGGRAGVLSLHMIESAISRPYSGYHRSIAGKAAALLESVASNHGFADGNKRTSLILVELSIGRSGYRLDIPGDEPFNDLIVDVASGRIGYDGLVGWFAARLTRKTA